MAVINTSDGLAFDEAGRWGEFHAFPLHGSLNWLFHYSIETMENVLVRINTWPVKTLPILSSTERDRYGFNVDLWLACRAKFWKGQLVVWYIPSTLGMGSLEF